MLNNFCYNAVDVEMSNSADWPEFWLNISNDYPDLRLKGFHRQEYWQITWKTCNYRFITSSWHLETVCDTVSDHSRNTSAPSIQSNITHHFPKPPINTIVTIWQIITNTWPLHLRGRFTKRIHIFRSVQALWLWFATCFPVSVLTWILLGFRWK